MTDREKRLRDALEEIAFSGMTWPLAFGDLGAEEQADWYRRRAYDLISIAARALKDA